MVSIPLKHTASLCRVTNPAFSRRAKNGHAASLWWPARRTAGAPPSLPRPTVPGSRLTGGTPGGGGASAPLLSAPRSRRSVDGVMTHPAGSRSSPHLPAAAIADRTDVDVEGRGGTWEDVGGRGQTRTNAEGRGSHQSSPPLARLRGRDGGPIASEQGQTTDPQVDCGRP